MTIIDDFNITVETISKTGLRLSDEAINVQVASSGARVFEYPLLN